MCSTQNVFFFSLTEGFYIWPSQSNCMTSSTCNDIPRYLVNIITIYPPDFAKYIPDIYPTEHQLTKANKETSFPDLNVKIIGTCKYDKRDYFRFQIVNFLWLNCDVPRLSSHGIAFRSVLDLLGVVQSFRGSILKIFKSPRNYIHLVTEITGIEKHLESSSDHTLSFYRHFMKYRFKNMFLKKFLTLSSKMI